MNGARHPATRGLGALLVISALFIAPAAEALPPLDTVLEQLTRFRAATDDVTGRGRVTYGPHDDVRVELTRNWSEPPTLRFNRRDFVADWADPDLDVVLRLVGAALSAEDLPAALTEMGRSFSPEVAGLVLREGVLTYVLGGPPQDPTVHLYVERDTYRLVSVELPMPEGVYRVELADYSLAEGWFPQTISVHRGERTLFVMRLSELERN